MLNVYMQFLIYVGIVFSKQKQQQKNKYSHYFANDLFTIFSDYFVFFLNLYDRVTIRPSGNQAIHSSFRSS